MADLSFNVARVHLLNANQRIHWSTRNDLTKILRTTAHQVARYERVPARIGRTHVRIRYTFKDRPVRDPANLHPTSKALVDGLTDAGLWPDDDSRYVVGPTNEVEVDKEIRDLLVRVEITFETMPGRANGT